MGTVPDPCGIYVGGIGTIDGPPTVPRPLNMEGIVPTMVLDGSGTENPEFKCYPSSHHEIVPPLAAIALAHPRTKIATVNSAVSGTEKTNFSRLRSARQTHATVPAAQARGEKQDGKSLSRSRSRSRSHSNEIHRHNPLHESTKSSTRNSLTLSGFSFEFISYPPVSSPSDEQQPQATATSNKYE